VCDCFDTHSRDLLIPMGMSYLKESPSPPGIDPRFSGITACSLVYTPNKLLGPQYIKIRLLYNKVIVPANRSAYAETPQPVIILTS
jgi:hypothetical protein